MRADVVLWSVLLLIGLNTWASSNVAFCLSLEEWDQKLLEELKKRNKTPPRVVVIPDDWTTGGNWTSPGELRCPDYRLNRRYGTDAAWLFGMDAGSNMVICKNGRPEPYAFRVFLGERANVSQAPQIWLQWPYVPKDMPWSLSEQARESTRGYVNECRAAGLQVWNWRDTRRVLVNPVSHGRRQATVEDRAEQFRPWFSESGSDLYINITIPKGPNLLSLFFVNDDGHGTPENRFRDYRIEIKDQLPDYGEKAGWERRYDEQPLLAESRVADFYDGVFKRFVVYGKAPITIRIRKGRSLSTILSAVFLDDWIPKLLFDDDKYSRSRGPDSGRSQMIYALCRKLRYWRKESVTAFFEMAPLLAADASAWAKPQAGGSEQEHIECMKQVCTLLHLLLEYDARDALGMRYVEAITKWWGGADEPYTTNRDVVYRSHLFIDAREYRIGFSTSTYSAFFRSYAQQMLRAQGEKARGDVRRNASVYRKFRPPYARAILEELERYYVRTGKGDLKVSFDADELMTWAVCCSYLGEHAEARDAFAWFLERFPESERAQEASVGLKKETYEALMQEKVENQRFELTREGWWKSVSNSK